MSVAYRKGVVTVATVVGMTIGLCVVSLKVSAETYSSTNYKIDASTFNTAGGNQSSSSYRMVSSTGEAIIGNGSSGSYRLGEGYVAQLENPFIEINVQPNGLAGYFPLDEGVGTVAYDSSANTATGALTNGPTWAGAAKVGGGVTLDGSDDYINIPDSAALSPTSAMTVSAWVYGSAVNLVNSASLAGVVCKDTDVGDPVQNPPYCIGFTNNRNIIFTITNSSGTAVNAAWAANAQDNTWYHLVGTFDGTTMRLYVNGTQRATGSQTGIHDNNAPVHIGKQKDGFDRFYSGTVDEVKIYNRALSATEVKAEYDAQNAGYQSGLSLGSVTPGASNTVQFDTITRTNSPSYNLAINQSGDLTDGTHTIGAVSGSIATPAAWSEGTTKGLGFTLVSGSGISGVWGSGANYAALPGSATTFYSRTGYTPSAPDVLGMRLRLDVPLTVPNGNYANTMVITGTITP